MNKQVKEEDLWCEYSDLPSPLAYRECADYDSMGNHGRFPKIKSENGNMKNFLQKLILWVTFRFPKKKRKNIWKL